MLERVARALSANIKKQWVGTPAPGREFDPESWTATGGTLDLSELARAALEAMKNPTEEMIDVGRRKFWVDPEETDLDDGVKDAFNAMIDVALENK